jgi:hypothetical protein
MIIIIELIMTYLRWPTCISLAMLGEEKSTATVIGSTGGDVTPSVIRRVTCSRILMALNEHNTRSVLDIVVNKQLVHAEISMIVNVCDKILKYRQ